MASEASLLYSSTLSPVELAAVDVFVHRVLHLRCRKGLTGYPEEGLLVDCWWPDPPPDTAIKAALLGEPGSVWCPHITGSLRGAVE
jgi:hypothetical protein